MPDRFPAHTLRQILLWSAAALVAGDTPPARLRVRIDYRGGALEVRPCQPGDLEPPDPADFVPNGAEAARAIFSEDERAIVRTLDTSQLTLKVLVSRTGIKRSRLAILAGNLRDRGIVTSNDRGYELTRGPWLELAAGQPPAT